MFAPFCLLTFDSYVVSDLQRVEINSWRQYSDANHIHKHTYVRIVNVAALHTFNTSAHTQRMCQIIIDEQAQRIHVSRFKKK